MFNFRVNLYNTKLLIKVYKKKKLLIKGHLSLYLYGKRLSDCFYINPKVNRIFWESCFTML